MPDDEERLIAAERALQDTGLFYSQEGDGGTVYLALKTKYPEAILNFVVLRANPGFVLTASNLIPRVRLA
ncbi:hypothetical protein BH10PSE7_BH10PSE7_33590 [soil metagenome]